MEYSEEEVLDILASVVPADQLIVNQTDVEIADYLATYTFVLKEDSNMTYYINQDGTVTFTPTECATTDRK